MESYRNRGFLTTRESEKFKEFGSLKVKELQSLKIRISKRVTELE